MNLQNLIGGMSAAQAGGQIAAQEAREAERQVRELERMRAQDALSARNEQYRQGLMQQVEGPESLPGGTPVGISTPTMGAEPASAPVAPARQAPTGPSPFLSPTAPNQSAAESARLARSGSSAPSAAPYANLAGRTPPASETGAQGLATMRGARMRRFANPQAAAQETGISTTDAQRLAELQRLNAQGQAPAQQAAAPAANAPRGIRNNNPGNIIASDFATRMGATGRDADGFAIFPDAATGERASVALLGLYGQQGLNTVEQVVSKWSPANAPGNSPQATQNYINFVAQQLGVAPNAQLNMQDPQVLQRIAAAKFRFENGQQVAQGQAPAAQPAAPGAPAPQAAAPAAPAAPNMQFTPEQITQISAQAQQESRMAQMRLQELNRMLQLAPDAATASKIREQANQIRFGGFTAQLTDATAQAMGGNQQALAQLATAARVAYAQTPQGFVEVALDPASNQYKAVSQPMPLNTFINQLYSVATGAAAKAEAQRREAALKVQGEIAVEQVKGLNKLREVSATGERDLQKLLAERSMSMDDIDKVTTAGGLGKEQILVTTKGGQVAIFQPAQATSTGPSRPRLIPIQQ